MTDFPPDLDALGLQTTGVGLKATIGDVDIAPALFGGSQKTIHQEPPTAELRVDPRLLAGQPVDYFGSVEFGGGSSPMPGFVGNVTSAAPYDDGLRIQCMTQPSLKDRKVGGFESFNCDAREIVHLVTRTGGLNEDEINIEGFEELPLEVVEVFIPLFGVRAEGPLGLGPLSLIEPDTGRDLTAKFSDSDMRSEFESADSLAVYRQVTRHMFVAETAALHSVDVMLAWLTARARYGLAFLPDGTPQEFVRRRALSEPSRGNVALTRGIDSRRTWIRDISQAPSEEVIDLASGDPQWSPPAPGNLTTAHQLALLALRRATTLDDTLQRIGALWEAIEFYVAGVRTLRRFSDREARRVRKRVPKDIDPELRERVMNLLAKINDPPLMAKLRHAARLDGVPLTEGEMDLLWRIRDVRNKTVHGRHAVVPSASDVDYGVSVVARLLLHGIARSA